MLNSGTDLNQAPKAVDKGEYTLVNKSHRPAARLKKRKVINSHRGGPPGRNGRSLNAKLPRIWRINKTQRMTRDSPSVR